MISRCVVMQFDQPRKPALDRKVRSAQRRELSWWNFLSPAVEEWERQPGNEVDGDRFFANES